MYKGLLLQDNSGNQPGTGFGAHVHVGNASEPFTLTYFGGGNNGNVISRRLDPIVMKGAGRSGRGYAHTCRGRTWDFICRVSQSGS